MTLTRAANIVTYGGNRPEPISPARWGAMVKYVNREILGKVVNGKVPGEQHKRGLASIVRILQTSR